MALRPIAGMKIYIGGVLADKAADFVEADFSGQTWTEIDGWSQMGGLGDTAQDISTSLINRGRDIHQKGTANAPAMQNVFAQIPDDAGQAALIVAAAPSNRNNYAFRIDGNDSNGGSPSKRYFIALAMSANEAGGAANTIGNLDINLQPNSNIVRVAAT
ncbi:hypothetical protein [Tardiphaga sp.]|uniref:hypothetical protein n=1 Tax=Tardiphaga sp. TaxID=1926292 RepID=UPI00261463D6|nr:hypothetical protein [Tardiphaga sp.]MDB5620513.1 hypothetical protein [Tardiphaga sp.]